MYYFHGIFRTNFTLQSVLYTTTRRQIVCRLSVAAASRNPDGPNFATMKRQYPKLILTFITLVGTVKFLHNRHTYPPPTDNQIRPPLTCANTRRGRGMSLRSSDVLKLRYNNPSKVYYNLHIQAKLTLYERFALSVRSRYIVAWLMRQDLPYDFVGSIHTSLLIIILQE